MPDLTKYQTAPPLFRELWQDLMEKDDRNSPAEYPEMCLITFEEFAGYLEAAATDARRYGWQPDSGLVSTHGHQGAAPLPLGGQHYIKPK